MAHDDGIVVDRVGFCDCHFHALPGIIAASETETKPPMSNQYSAHPQGLQRPNPLSTGQKNNPSALPQLLLLLIAGDTGHKAMNDIFQPTVEDPP
jgi:hypothetical protein